MRIRFAARSDEDEALALDRLRQRVDAFWSEARQLLAAATPAPDDHAARHRLERALRAALERASEDVDVELDVLENGERRVVIFPVSESGGEPLAEEVVARGPRSGKFSVVRFRPPLTAHEAIADVRARLGVDLERARVRMGFSRGHLLEVVVYSPNFSSAADDAALDAAWLLTSRLIGEEKTHAFVGSVDVAPLPRGGSLRVLRDAATAEDATMPLTDVSRAVEAAINGLHSGLPDAPYHRFCEHAEWTLLELEPALADDYRAQDDVAMVSTMLPEALKSFLQGSPFSSARFSKHGERFVYVKVEGLGRSAPERHELRMELEDVLNALLVPGGIGCVVGVGIGARYVYVDLALSNLEHGMRVTRDRLRRLESISRGWILFCDAGWEAEWIAIGDHGPPP